MLLPQQTTASFDCVAFDAESRFLIAGGGGRVKGKGPRDKTYRELVAWNLADGELLWQVYEPGDNMVNSFAVRPASDEFSALAMSDMRVYSLDGKLRRQYKTDFLSGEVAFSPDGKHFVAPKGNELKLCNADTGETAVRVELSDDVYQSGEAAGLLPSGKELLIGMRVINSKGQTSGKVLLVDLAKKEILKSSNLEVVPSLVAVDPQGRWACLGGTRKGRGAVLFWDLQKWTSLHEQCVHLDVTGLAMSPDGEQLATTGINHVVRIWERSACKTISTLEPGTTSRASAGVAWSPDGNYVAVATYGKPPEGGLFLYRLQNGKWEMVGREKP